MSKRQYSDRSSSPASTARKVVCPHIERYFKHGSPVAKIESSAFKKQLSSSTLSCDWCETRIPRSRCRTVVCSSNSRSHMREHFDITYKESKPEASHAVYINPRTLTIWCYGCGIEINPFSKDQELSQETRNYLKTVQVKRIKSQHSNDQLPIDVPVYFNVSSLLVLSPAIINYFNYCNAYIPRNNINVNPRHPKYRLAEPFNQFIEAMWSGTSPIFAPIKLINEIKRHNEAFRGFSQEDSAEFLRVILDRLHEELPYPQNTSNHTQINGNINNLVYMNNFPSAGAGVDTMHYASGISSPASSASSTTTSKTYEKFQRRHSSSLSIISDVFQGVYESKIKCLHCKKESSKDDDFYVLPIQVDKKFRLKSQEKGSNGVLNNVVGSIGDWLGIGGRTVKLQDCLAAFCATENLTGEDKYRCDGCKSLTDCQKVLRITRLPESLCIQIKRFRFDSYLSTKIVTNVQFPMEDLDMSPYCKESRDSLDNSKYSLYGLIHHRGVIGGGHYVAYAKNPIDDNWYEFDDTYVTRKTATEVSRLEAYVLFYRKTNLEKEEERQEILSKISDSESEAHLFVSRLWFNRWQFMMTPGPITNNDFICSHGGVNWRVYPKLHDMVVRIPFSVYTLLMEKYGTDGSQPFHADDYSRAGCKICEQEERKLDQRRRKEAHDINQIDTNTISRGECWYLISNSWLQSWHSFKDGGPLPGTIDNTTFLREDGRPKPGMRRAIDYRAVNARVWNYFVHSYGGGPICIRGTIDLYSSPYSL
ncbi:15402_t:CDS:10 [Dentiscutata erythropus]|uniref:15402_t:CDS:1 n=1 Tax=Dentiscutata erythropus TaxID=1348616 RepID=A0A9N9B3Y3_9GLOM|nr:15402_t:CDS:10 [Dentiscutata erythropus]